MGAALDICATNRHETIQESPKLCAVHRKENVEKMPELILPSLFPIEEIYKRKGRKRRRRMANSSVAKQRGGNNSRIII